MYIHHENEKKAKYNYRVINIEHASFSPLVFSTTGGMATECHTFFKRLGDMIARKIDQKYSHVMGYIRRKLRFELLKACLISIRGHKGRYYERAEDIDDLDFDYK